MKTITMTRQKIQNMTTTAMKLKLINKNKEYILMKTRINPMIKRIMILPMKKMKF